MTATRPNIILLDLNSTLSANMRQVMANNRRPFAERIEHVEQYRGWLVEWLKLVDWEVHLFTVRNERYRDVTLKSIIDKTGWRPHGAWFNNTRHEGRDAHLAKGEMLTQLIARHDPQALYALESNARTREMYSSRDVPSLRIATPEDLPSLAGFRDDGTNPPVPPPPPDKSSLQMNLE